MNQNFSVHVPVSLFKEDCQTDAMIKLAGKEKKEDCDTHPTFDQMKSGRIYKKST
jgi:hypothetical protein